MDAGVGVMIFMGLILKIPVVAACWLLWYAIRSTPEPASSEEGGGEQPHRWYRREPKRPRGPRRGPHAPDALPLPCPEDESPARGTRRPLRPRVALGAADEHRTRTR